MARLSADRRPSRGAFDDRGQVLLVGAFGIAVLLLVFAGVLNTVTYTEALATQGGDHRLDRDVVAFQQDARHGVEDLLDRVNDGTGTYSTKAARLDRSVGNWNDAVARQYAADVTGVTVTLVDSTNGSRIVQSAPAPLTNANGTSNWTLARSVTGTRGFLLELNTTSLTSDACGSGACYTVVVDDGTDTWTVSVNRSAVVVDGATPGTCAISADPVTIDVTGGTVDGQPCSPLQFADGVSSPYTISFRNGENATGTYRLSVETSDVPGDDYAATGPTVSQIVYDASVRVTYRTPQLTYANVLRVEGGELDV
ncbi:MAG: hypothetical protein ABEI57_06440 [Halapricum sp.]